MGNLKVYAVSAAALILAGCCGHGCHQHVWRDGNNPNSVYEQGYEQKTQNNYNYNLRHKGGMHQNQ